MNFMLLIDAGEDYAIHWVYCEPVGLFLNRS